MRFHGWCSFCSRCVTAVAVAATIGCSPPATQQTKYERDLPPTIDRLVKAYDDLASKRFEVIATFEQADEGSLFHLEPAGGASAAGVSTERAKPDTGVGSLRMPLLDSSRQVVARDSAEGKWALPRDWTRYQLLIFSVFSPRKLSGFNLSVRSGTRSPLTYTNPRMVLTTGWNLIRLDLGDMTDQLNLADVRELRFWCDPLESPVELYLDDLILVDNARQVFTSTQGETGDLYVRAEGRRLVVGAAERFELVFSRGRLRQWFDLGHDPGRTHNLAGVGGMGPMPVVVPREVNATVLLDDLSQWSGLGVAAETFQTLLEATPLRVLVQGECRFSTPESPAGENSPYQRCVFSIYRDGRVYLDCSGTARRAGFEPPGLGMVFCCDGAFGFQRTIAEPKLIGEPGADGLPLTAAGAQAAGEAYVLFNRGERGQADLLVAPSRLARPRVLENAQDPRLCVLWPIVMGGDVFTFAAMLRVWPADVDSPTQASPMARDYQHPLPLDLDTGRLVQTDPGDLDNDGFSEGRGYYTLQLDGNIAKVRIDGRKNPRFGPVFKLVDVADREVWVYVDGRQIKELQRDADGHVMFEVPGVISHEALLEITSKVREAGVK